MYNYHTSLVLKIDYVLSAALFLLSALTILYAVINEYARKRHRRALAGIKENVYAMVLSGRSPDAKVCLPFTGGMTDRQFLDAATNRNRDAVFFNEDEQKALKNCFMSDKKLAEIEKIAARSRDKWRRIEAILSLGYAGTKAVPEALKKSIGDGDKDVVYFSIIALGQIRTAASAKVLIDYIRKNKIYRYKIISVLEAFPPDIARDAIELTADRDPDVRVWAVRLTARLKADQYLKRIEEMAHDASDDVRAAVCDCLGAFGRKEAKVVLQKFLKDDFWLVRAQAVKSLSSVLGDDCVPEIIGRVNDTSLSVLESVKDVLVEHIESALPYIDGFLHGKDELAKKISVEALETSGYVMKILSTMLSGGDKERAVSLRLLEGMIKAQARLGLESALAKFPQDKREMLLETIRGFDAERR